jgi:hypothetical protein
MLKMTMREVIRTSGDLRRTLAQTMNDIRSGDLTVDKGLAIAALAKEITATIQAEVNVAKVQSAMLKEGRSIGDLTHLGKMIIEDAGTVPVLNGIVE